MLLGAIYKNQKVGNCKWSHITVFSFHPVKIITTFEGGAATTNDKKIYERLKLFSNHGITKTKSKFFYKKMGPWYYEQQVLGLNYRLTDVAASLGLSQLKKLKKFIKIRNKLAKLYNKNLNIKYVKIPFIDKNTFSSFHLYVIKINNKYKKFHHKTNFIIYEIKELMLIYTMFHYISILFIEN